MINLITKHIDIWTAAQTHKKNGGRGRVNNPSGQSPHGIKKLRDLILEFAVRGKLVPQDPSEEPASVLLEQIAKEKKRLIKDGKIKKQKSLPDVGKDAESVVLVHLLNDPKAPAESLCIDESNENSRGHPLEFLRRPHSPRGIDHPAPDNDVDSAAPEVVLIAFLSVGSSLLRTAISSRGNRRKGEASVGNTFQKRHQFAELLGVSLDGYYAVYSRGSGLEPSIA